MSVNSKHRNPTLTQFIRTPAKVMMPVSDIKVDETALLSSTRAKAVEPHPAVRSHGRPIDMLTAQERKIIHYVCETGDGNRHVGLHFGIAEDTVKRHLSNIFNKLGCDSRLQMVMIWERHLRSQPHSTALEETLGLRVQELEARIKELEVELEIRDRIIQYHHQRNAQVQLGEPVTDSHNVSTISPLTNAIS